MDVRNTVLADQWPLEVDFPCQPRKYRAYNGYCNNVQNPRWGNANTRYLRFLPPDYSDGKLLFSKNVVKRLSRSYPPPPSVPFRSLLRHHHLHFIIFAFVHTGVSIPRQANDGLFLPSSRDISLAVHKDVDNPHAHLTAMAAIWGQLVHHDISHTPQMAGKRKTLQYFYFFRLNELLLLCDCFFLGFMGIARAFLVASIRRGEKNFLFL